MTRTKFNYKSLIRYPMSGRLACRGEGDKFTDDLAHWASIMLTETRQHIPKRPVKLSWISYEAA